MYPEPLVMPMKAELVNLGFEDLTTPDAVNNTLSLNEGTVLMVVNSVCGCAAGAARPGVRLALENAPKKPNKLATVFAGFDAEAVAEARKHFEPYPPSSPCMAIFKNGKLVHFIERHQIEGRNAQMIGEHLKAAFDAYC